MSEKRDWRDRYMDFAVIFTQVAFVLVSGIAAVFAIGFLVTR